MKNQFLPLVFFAMLVFAFSACEKEPAHLEISTPLLIDDEAALARLNEQVLFLHDFQSAETGERTGFFIDKYGNLKSYRIHPDNSKALPLHSVWSIEDIEYLRSLAETEHLTIAAAELLAYAKMTGRASLGSLTERIDRPGQPGTSTYVALQWDMAMEGSGGCEPGNSPHGSNVGETFYNVIILKTEGSTLQENTHQQAKEITAWLKNLQSEAGL